jgi:uncharacterized membrane protein YbaN (DUF454 family)
MNAVRTPRQTALAVLGCVSLATGIVGIFVPLLPTTCFVLLAAWCFARSSPRLHRWLRNHQMFGPIVRSWEADRSVPLRAKYAAVGVTTLTCTASALLVSLWWVQLILATVVVGVAALMWRLPTRVEGATASS